jgi:hypothetical protein
MNLTNLFQPSLKSQTFFLQRLGVSLMHEICQQLHDPTPNRGPLFGLNDATILEMLTTEKKYTADIKSTNSEARPYFIRHPV